MQSPWPTPEAVEQPKWLDEAREKYTLRVSDWFWQSVAMTIAPRRFMADWAEGKREALNPLRFLAMGSAISFAFEHWGRKLLHVGDTPHEGLFGIVYSSFGNTLVMLAMGACMHLPLRVRSKAPLRSSIAAVIYATTGPSTFLYALGWCSAALIYVVRGSTPLVDYAGAPWPLPVLAMSFLSFLWVFAAQQGVHRVRLSWLLLSIGAFPIVFGLISLVVGMGIAVLEMKLGVRVLPRP